MQVCSWPQMETLFSPRKFHESPTPYSWRDQWGTLTLRWPPRPPPAAPGPRADTPVTSAGTRQTVSSCHRRSAGALPLRPPRRGNCWSPGNNYTHGRSPKQSNKFQHRRVTRPRGVAEPSTQKASAPPFMSWGAVPVCSEHRSPRGHRRWRIARDLGDQCLLNTRSRFREIPASALWLRKPPSLGQGLLPMEVTPASSFWGRCLRDGG